MTLPSQNARATGLARQINARGRGIGITPFGKLVFAFVGLLIVGGLAWAAFSMFGGDGKSVTGPSTANAAEIREPGAGDTPPPPRPRSLMDGVSSSRQAEPTSGGPVVLEQGNSNPSNLNAGNSSPTTVPGANLPAGNTDPGAGKPAPVDVTKDMEPISRPTPKAEPQTPATATPPPATTPEPLTPSSSAQAVRRLIEAGDSAAASGRLVDARVSYSKAYIHPEAAPGDKSSLRAKLTAINDDLVFSSKVTQGDPLAEVYTVAPGDSLVKIARKRDLATDWRLIQRVNGISHPNRIQVGQKLKLLRGPFHAVVTKNDYRLDLFAGSPDEPDNWLYIRSYTVGLGEGNGTPTGEFVIRKGSKLVNPHWVNPRTGEKFDANDPKNPIGEHWLGWEGVGSSSMHTGYGLHGTIDPDSIGKQKSMGCVRMADGDIAAIYDLLVEQVSRVRVVP